MSLDATSEKRMQGKLIGPSGKKNVHASKISEMQTRGWSTLMCPQSTISLSGALDCATSRFFQTKWKRKSKEVHYNIDCALQEMEAPAAVG